MKLFQCPNCHGPVVIDVSGMANNELLKCSSCGYTDYTYTFGFAEGRNNLGIEHERILEVMTIIRNIVEREGIDNYNVNSLISDINVQCPALSPVMICHLINSILDSMEENVKTWANETMFVEYICEEVTIEQLLEHEHMCYKPIISNQTIYNNEVDVMQTKCQELKHEVDKWKSDYLKLSGLYQKVKEENEFLRYKLNINNK